MIVITKRVLIYIMQCTNIPLRRFAEASFWEWKMSSQITAHFPADSVPRGDGGARSPERPVVLIAFAKLVLMAGALVVLTPLWLDVLSQLAYGPPPQAWVTLRVVALLGGAAWVVLAGLILRVWTRLLKHLARAD